MCQGLTGEEEEAGRDGGEDEPEDTEATTARMRRRTLRR
jgi:hypothetical protein